MYEEQGHHGGRPLYRQLDGDAGVCWNSESSQWLFHPKYKQASERNDAWSIAVPDGASALAKLIKKARNLTKVDVTDNNLSHESVKLLHDAASLKIKNKERKNPCEVVPAQ